MIGSILVFMFSELNGERTTSTIYVDDVLYNQITPDDTDGGEWVFNQPFYILINVAVGGTFVGNPNDNTVFPQTMLVDYVRIYE
jgi:beta-glucanase (GH16 family)